jgi:hypothetical protein
VLGRRVEDLAIQLFNERAGLPGCRRTLVMILEDTFKIK